MVSECALSAQVTKNSPFLAFKFVPRIFEWPKLQINISSLTEMSFCISWQKFQCKHLIIQKLWVVRYVHYRVWGVSGSLSKLKQKMNSENLAVIGLYNSCIESVVKIPYKLFRTWELFDCPSVLYRVLIISESVQRWFVSSSGCCRI